MVNNLKSRFSGLLATHSFTSVGLSTLVTRMSPFFSNFQKNLGRGWPRRKAS